MVTTVIAMALTVTGYLAALAETVVLLLSVFLSTDIAVLVPRRQSVDHEHFRVFTPIPYLAVASCLLLLSQQAPRVWLRAGVLLAIGVVLYAAGRIVDRRGTATGQAPR